MTEILLHLSYLAAIGFCCCTLGWLWLQADKNPVTRALAVCQILIIIWCLPQLFLVFSGNREMKYVLYGISYVGISFIGPAWLQFSFLYCGRRIPSRIRLTLAGLSLFDYAMFWTNGLHHLFYLQFDLEKAVYGPVFYFHMVCTYICVLTGMAALFLNLGRKKTAPMAVMILAAAIPLGFNLLYLSGTVKTGFDLTPPVFALSGFLLLVAVFRYDFLDVNVAASRRIFESMAEGVVICSRRGTVAYCNHPAAVWLKTKPGDGYEVLQEKIELMKEASPGDRIQLKQYTLHDRKGTKTGWIFLLTDMGEYYERLRQSRELAVSEQRLAIERERNRIAQEVHDTTGHTLTMINSLLKLIRIRRQAGERQEGEEDRETEEYLRQAQELAAGGIRELRWSISHLRQGSACGLVTEGVYQLAAGVRELEVEVEIQGEDGPQYSHLSSVVYRCLREALTNCLKYAHAAHMDVIVKFAGDSISVYIFDNGQGCSSIKESHGLAGIRRRVQETGGQVRFLSAEGEGFQIFIRLPVRELSELCSEKEGNKI